MDKRSKLVCPRPRDGNHRGGDQHWSLGETGVIVGPSSVVEEGQCKKKTRAKVLGDCSYIAPLHFQVKKGGGGRGESRTREEGEEGEYSRRISVRTGLSLFREAPVHNRSYFHPQKTKKQGKKLVLNKRAKNKGGKTHKSHLPV
jgi:hypothetical protein